MGMYGKAAIALRQEQKDVDGAEERGYGISWKGTGPERCTCQPPLPTLPSAEHL